MDQLREFNEKEIELLDRALGLEQEPKVRKKSVESQSAVIDMKDLRDEYYYSILNGVSDGFASSVNVYTGAYIKKHWKTLEYNKYSPLATRPPGYTIVELPDETCLAARIYGVHISGDRT